MATQDKLNQWHELAQQLRVDSIRSTTAAGSGHPTSSMSAADLMAVLWAKYFHYDFEQSDYSSNDHLIFSKGHASPLLYAMYKAAGVISDEQLLSLRQFGSPLEGHPVPKLPGIDVATGSLGQGLPVGVGIALAGKYLDQVDYRTWVLLGDSETAEGSVWDVFVRMAAISRANLKLCGSHAGISIGQDGPSQMGLEDIASLRAIWSSTVLYPCDGNQTAKLVAQMRDRAGIVYLRTTRMKTPVIYAAQAEFPIGGSKVLRSSDQDQVTIIGAGVTVHEALAAYNRLQQQGITARIIDAYSVKPIDVETLYQAAQATDGNLIIVEDHRCEGGLGSAVLDAFAGTDQAPAYSGAPLRAIKLAVRDLPGSGQPNELLHAAKIDADAIVNAAQSLVKALVKV